MIICWFYVKNYIFGHMTDKIYPMSCLLWRPLTPNVELLEDAEADEEGLVEGKGWDVRGDELACFGEF